MATMQDLLDDLNDRLNDANNAAGAGEVNKMRYINHGVRALWPKLYKTVADSSIALVADTYEYTLPSTFDNAKIFRVELETDPDDIPRFIHLYNYEIIPTLTGKILRLDHVELPEVATALIRIHGARPIGTMAATGTTYEGPPGTEEIPVWYAYGLVCQRRLEDRLVHTRYSTTAAQNGVDVEQIMAASQLAFSMFNQLLDQHEMPLPAQAG